MQREQTLNLCIYGFCYWICCFAVIALLCYSSTGGVTYCIVFPIVWFYCEVHLNFVKMKWSACQECGTKKKIKVPDRICFFSFFSFFSLSHAQDMLIISFSHLFHQAYKFSFLHLNIEFALYKFIFLIIRIIIILINTII